MVTLLRYLFGDRRSGRSDGSTTATVFAAFAFEKGGNVFMSLAILSILVLFDTLFVSRRRCFTYKRASVVCLIAKHLWWISSDRVFYIAYICYTYESILNGFRLICLYNE